MTSIRAPSPAQVGAIKSSVSLAVIDSGAERRTVIQNNIRPSGTKTRIGVIGATYRSTILPRNVAFGGRWKWDRTLGSHLLADEARFRPDSRRSIGQAVDLGRREPPCGCSDHRRRTRAGAGCRCENAPRHGREVVKTERIGSAGAEMRLREQSKRGLGGVLSH